MAYGTGRYQTGKNNNNYVHGHAQHGVETAEYRAWAHMKDRCYNPANKDFKDYGDRGIKVCGRWLNDFEAFLENMGRKPTAKHSLGRKDNNGDYTPDNCQWETRAQQSRNTRTVKLTMSLVREIRMLHDSRGYFLSELAREFSVSREVISRIVNNRSWKEDEE